jgi:hypothetical protein
MVFKHPTSQDTKRIYQVPKETMILSLLLETLRLPSHCLWNRLLVWIYQAEALLLDEDSSADFSLIVSCNLS